VGQMLVGLALKRIKGKKDSGLKGNWVEINS
jgi:hypothetical protein